MFEQLTSEGKGEPWSRPGQTAAQVGASSHNLNLSTDLG